MTVSHNVVIMTIEELRQQESLAYQRGVARGRFEEASARFSPHADALAALRWCVENDGECLADHHKRLAQFRDILAAAVPLSTKAQEP